MCRASRTIMMGNIVSKLPLASGLWQSGTENDITRTDQTQLHVLQCAGRRVHHHRPQTRPGNARISADMSTRWHFWRAAMGSTPVRRCGGYVCGKSSGCSLGIPREQMLYCRMAIGYGDCRHRSTASACDVRRRASSASSSALMSRFRASPLGERPRWANRTAATER